MLMKNYFTILVLIFFSFILGCLPLEEENKADTHQVVFRSALNNQFIEAMLIKDGETPIPPVFDIEGYDFVEWSPQIGPISEDITFIGHYKIRSYGVSFLDFNNEVIDIVSYEHGSPLGNGLEQPPFDESYQFEGYEVGPNELVTGEMEISPIFSKKSYNVSFWALKPYDQYLCRGCPATKSEIVLHGDSANPPTAPVLAEASSANSNIQVFDGWDTEYLSVTSDLEIFAKWTPVVSTIDYVLTPVHENATTGTFFALDRSVQFQQVDKEYFEDDRDGFYRSTDFGQNWQLLFKGLKPEVYFAPSNQKIIYLRDGETGEFKRSDDSGQSWTDLAEHGAHFFAVDLIDPNVLYIISTRTPIIEIDGFPRFGASTPAFYRSNDAGENWNHIFDIGSDWHFHQAADGTILIISKTTEPENSVLISRDSGETFMASALGWEVGTHPPSTNTSKTANIIVDGDEIYISGGNYSLNGGANWHLIQHDHEIRTQSFRNHVYMDFRGKWLRVGNGLEMSDEKFLNDWVRIGSFSDLILYGDELQRHQNLTQSILVFNDALGLEPVTE